MKTNYLLAACISISVALSAQQNVEEVIVTAEKTEKNILDIGTTMNLYNEDFMEDQKITELGQLSYYVPNFTVQEEDVINPSLSIRGVGADSGFLVSRIGRFMNGLTMSSTTMSSFALYDLTRVEILKGPQPSTFGVDSAAGAFNVVTNKAELGSTYGSLSMGFGNFNSRDLQSVNNISLTDSSSLRISTFNSDIKGYTKNIGDGDNVNGRGNVSALRLSYTNEITDNLILDVVINQENNKLPGVGYKSAYIFSENQDRSPYGEVDFRNTQDSKTEREMLTQQYFLNYSINKNSSASLSFFDTQSNTFSFIDTDGSYLNIMEAGKTNNADLSGFEAQYQFSNDKLDLMVGYTKTDKETYDYLGIEFAEPYLLAFLTFDGQFAAANGLLSILQSGRGAFSSSNVYGDNFPIQQLRSLFASTLQNNPFNTIPVPLPDGSIYNLPVDVSPYIQPKVQTESQDSSSFYVDATYHLTDDLSFTVGYRDSSNDTAVVFDAKECNRPLVTGTCQDAVLQQKNSHKDEGEPLLKLSSVYNYSDSLSFYITSSEGRISPYVSYTGVTPAETIESQDLGFNYVDSKLFLSGAIFSYDFSNYTVAQLNYNTGFTSYSVMETATIDGYEFYGNYVIFDSVKIFGSYGYQNAKLGQNTIDDKDFDYAGNTWRLAPESNYSIGISLDRGMANYILAYTYQDDVYFEESNDLDTYQEGYGLLNLNVNVAISENVSTSIYFKNIMDEEFLIDGGNVGGDVLGLPTYVAGPPLMFGVSLSARF